MTVPTRCRREADAERGRERLGVGGSIKWSSGRHGESHFLSGHLTEWRCLWHTNWTWATSATIGIGIGAETAEPRAGEGAGQTVDCGDRHESVPIKLVLDARHERMIIVVWMIFIIFIIMIIVSMFVVAIFEVAAAAAAAASLSAQFNGPARHCPCRILITTMLRMICASDAEPNRTDLMWCHAPRCVRLGKPCERPVRGLWEACETGNSSWDLYATSAYTRYTRSSCVGIA